MDDEYLPLTEAAKHAAISRAKLWRMVKEGRLPAYEDPRDARVTLLKRDELEAAMRPVPRRIEPGGQGKAAA